jgi:hypothetical protein
MNCDKDQLYKSLEDVLDRALHQAECGKGKERHARGDTPFDRQPICEIGRMVGIGYNLGQAMKKAQEASRLPDPQRMIAELLGAINYLASAVILIEEANPPTMVDVADEMCSVVEALYARHSG